MKKPIKFFHDIVYRVAEQSECLSRKVGSIIVVDGRIVAEGWNSPPRKCDTKDCKRCKTDIKSGSNLELALCSHSEQNCISSAAYLGFSIKGSTLICTTKPCAECSKLIVAVGITKVIYFEEYKNEYTDLIFKNAEIECINGTHLIKIEQLSSFELSNLKILYERSDSENDIPLHVRDYYDSYKELRKQNKLY